MKSFAQENLFEEFFENENFFSKRMFSGLAYYYYGKLVTVLMENPDEPEWNGILIPTEREHHDSLMADLPDTTSHSVLGKWLYLPLNADAYETTAQGIVTMVRRRDPRIGVLPSVKSKKTKKAEKTKNSPKMNTVKKKKISRKKK